MRRDAHNVRKTLKKVQNASRMYVLDMCGYKKWVLQPQFTYRQPPQAHSAHSNMGGSEALTTEGGGEKIPFLRCSWEPNNLLLSAVSSALDLPM